MRQLNFKAIAAVGAIDQQGILKALYTCDSSVNVDRFIEFLKLITPAEGKKPYTVFLDNLRVHHSKRVKDYCSKNRIELLFNASYSSEVNPIERLWSLSKRNFSRHLIDPNSTQSNQQHITHLVRSSITSAPSAPL